MDTDLRFALLRHCEESIEDFQMQEQIALGRMEQKRCPLAIANPDLFDEMADAIAEYCEENGIAEDVDTEDVFCG